MECQKYNQLALYDKDFYQKNQAYICQAQGWNTDRGIKVSGEIGDELISTTLLTWRGVAGWLRQQFLTLPLLPGQSGLFSQGMRQGHAVMGYGLRGHLKGMVSAHLNTVKKS